MNTNDDLFTTIPLAVCLPAAQRTTTKTSFPKSTTEKKSTKDEENDDETAFSASSANKTILNALEQVSQISDKMCKELEREMDGVLLKLLEMDERVQKCEKKVKNSQRNVEEESLLMVVESSREYPFGVVEKSGRKSGAGMSWCRYDETVREALQRANEKRPKRRAFKDLERMAQEARRYGDRARALARSLMKGGDGRERNVVVDAKRILRRRGSLADVVPAKTAFYDCEALRFGGKGKGGDGDTLEEEKEKEEEKEVWKDGNEAEELSDGFAKKLFLSLPPPKSIAIPEEFVRSARARDADVNNASTSNAAGDEESVSAKKSLESVFSFRPKASDAPVVVFPGTLPSPGPSASKKDTGEKSKEGDGGSDLYEFTLTSENPYSPSAFLRNPPTRTTRRNAQPSKKGGGSASALTSQKRSVGTSSNSSNDNVNRPAPSSVPAPPPPPPPSNTSRQTMPSPAAGDDGRGALMEAIRRGANLRKVSVSTDQDKKPRKSNATSDTDDKTKTGAGERTKKTAAAASRGGAQMSMMEELASQLQRRRSTVVSSQKDSTSRNAAQ